MIKVILKIDVVLKIFNKKKLKIKNSFFNNLKNKKLNS